MFEPTDEQRKTLATWFSALHQDGRGHEFVIAFTLTLAGDKPALSLDRSDLVTRSGPFFAASDALEFIRGLGLATKEEGEGVWYCTRTPSLFDILPSQTSDGDDSVRQRGEFFGYPMADVEWIVNTPPGERIEPKSRAENGDFAPEELAHVDLLPYLHEDSIEGYERAIENGTRIRERIDELADHWNLPVIDEMVEEHYEISREVYAGERDHFLGEKIGFRMITKNPALD